MKAIIKKDFLIFILGCILSVLSAGVFQIGIFLFIWPACILYAFRKINKKKMIIIYYVIYVLFMIIKYYNLSGGYIWLDIIGYIAFSLLEIIPFVVDCLLYEKFKERIGYLACLIYPLTYVILSISISLVYPIIELSASLAPYLYLSQIVSVFGSNFLTFITLLFSTTLFYILDRVLNNKSIKKELVISGSVLMIILLYGIIKTHTTVETFEVKIGSVLCSDLGDFYEDTYINSPLEEDKLFIKEKIEQAKGLDCDILITAEESCELLMGEEEEYKAFVSNLAKENGIPILTSVDVYLTEDGSYRKDCAYYFDKNGEFMGEYVKHSLLPYEDLYYLKGESEPFYIEEKLDEDNFLKITTSICYDINNKMYISSCNKNTNLLVNQSWCWDEIDFQQQNIQLLRSLELGTSFMSSTIDATSTSYSYNGVKVDECYRYLEGRRDIKVFTLDIPKTKPFTLYSYIYKFIDLMYPLLAGCIIVLELYKKNSKYEKKL